MINQVRNKVKEITRYNPKRLRMAALQFYAENFGAQFLNESFGLSITQSERYARIEENLMGDLVKDELGF